MKSLVSVIKICEKFANTGLSGKSLEKFLEVLLRVVNPRAKVIEKNMRIVFPESSEQWRKNMRVKAYENLAWTVTEILALQKNPEQAFDWVKRIDGENYLDELLTHNHGAVMLTAHFGNWELLGSWYAQNAKKHAHKMCAIYQEIHDPDFHKYVQELRKRNKISLLPKEVSSLEFARILRTGSHIAILNDVSWHGKLILPFFGKDCTVSPGAAVLSMLADVPIVPICLQRNAPFEHVVKIYEPFFVAKDKNLTKEERIKNAVLECNRALERMILERPDLWFWLHNRWK